MVFHLFVLLELLEFVLQDLSTQRNILINKKYLYLNILIFSNFSAFTDSLNSVSCTFLHFYDNVKNGQNTTITPKWIGITGIKTTLDETQNALDNIAKNSNNAFQNSSWTQTEPDEFRRNLTNTYNKFSGSTLNNYNPSPSNKQTTTLVPIYIERLGDYQKENTALSSINLEFDKKISVSIKLIEEAQKYSKEITKYSQPIKDALNSVKNQLTPLENSFNNVENDVIKEWNNAVS